MSCVCLVDWIDSSTGKWHSTRKRGKHSVADLLMLLAFAMLLTVNWLSLVCACSVLWLLYLWLSVCLLACVLKYLYFCQLSYQFIC